MTLRQIILLELAHALIVLTFEILVRSYMEIIHRYSRLFSASKQYSHVSNFCKVYFER